MTDAQSTPQPDAAIKALDRLVGTWAVSGGATGQVRYEWMEGGFFLIQHVDLSHDQPNKGIEIIGRELAFGSSAPSEDIKTRFYGSRGETFDYVYELEGDTLTIWGGEKGSPAYFKGTFEDDDTLAGAWHWSGGGYESTMKQIAV